MKKKHRNLVYFFVLLALGSGLFLGCPQSVSTCHEQISKLQTIVLSINGFPLEIELSRSVMYYDVPMLMCDKPNIISSGSLHDFKLSINNTEMLPNYSILLELPSLEETRTIELKISKETRSFTYYIRTLNSTIPKLKVTGSGAGNGYYYFSPYTSRFLLKMDTTGKLVFYKMLRDSGTDFKSFKIDGKIYYSYLEAIWGKYKLDNIGYAQSRAIVMDSNYTIIKTIPYMHASSSIPAEHPLENHDFIYLGDDHYIISSYVGKTVSNIPDSLNPASEGVKIVATILQEIKNGSLVWEWDSTNYPELYALSVFKSKYSEAVLPYKDYAHFNSISIDPNDNNFICSFRHFDSVIKINRDTGEIMWKLGGTGDNFNLTEDQKFSRQHKAYFTDEGSLVLYDNGNAKEQTRVLEFKLNEVEKKVTSCIINKLDGYYFPAMGSAQKLQSSDNIYLIGWGWKTTSGKPIISEVNFDTKEILFEVSFQNDNSKLNGTYRAYKADF